MINFLGIGKCKNIKEFLDKKIADCNREIAHDNAICDYQRAERIECYRDAYQQALDAYQMFEENGN